jgi:hypothetical protein
MTAHAAGPKATSNLPKASSVCLSTFRQEPVSPKQLDPNGNVVGPADQRSQIKTFNIAPSWTRLLNANTVFTLGAFIRRDQFNYYPSGNPFADLAPDLQQETLSQDRSNDKLPS